MNGPSFRHAKAGLSVSAFFVVGILLSYSGLLSTTLFSAFGPPLLSVILLTWLITDFAQTLRPAQQHSAVVTTSAAGAVPASATVTTRQHMGVALPFAEWSVVTLLTLVLALLAGSAGRLVGGGKAPVAVLTYHRIGVPPHPGYAVPTLAPAEFARQLAFLKRRGYETVTPEQVEAYWSGRSVAMPRRPLLITFDDGWRDNYRAARPMLMAVGYRALIFVTTDELDQRAMLRWSEVRALAREGFAIGVHSRHHLHLADLPQPRRVDELAASVRDLRLHTGLVADTASYPYGSGDLQPAVWRAAREAGLKWAFASHNFGLNVAPPNSYAVRRILVPSNPFLARVVFALTLW